MVEAFDLAFDLHEEQTQNKLKLVSRDEEVQVKFKE